MSGAVSVWSEEAGEPLGVGLRFASDRIYLLNWGDELLARGTLDGLALEEEGVTERDIRAAANPRTQ